MDCGACEPWVKAIEQDFAYLFAEHGFQWAHCEDARQGEHCLMVLESARARIKFEISQGTPVIYFGSLDSPIGWAQQVDGVPVWYVDNALLNFVESKSSGEAPASPAAAANAGASAATPGADRSTEALLAAAAARLRPHAAELIAAFAPDRPAGWWQAFNAYQAERLKQIRQRMRAR
jgi:hypothetical protein